MLRNERETTSRAGFTLLELVIALLIGAIMMLIARSFVEELSLVGPRIVRERARTDRVMNADEWLRELVRQADTDSSEATESFYADADSAEFTSWCQSPRGWNEHCTVVIRVQREGAMFKLAVDAGGQRESLIGPDSVALSLRYLAPSDTGLSLLSHWDGSLLPPAAIALIGKDTTFLRVGRRG